MEEKKTILENKHGDNKPVKILLFKNIFNSLDKEQNKWLSPGILYLASSLKRAGLQVILSDSKISLQEEEFITNKEQLERILKENPDIKFIGISLCEDFFEKARKLVKFLRKRSSAFIGVGGVMPTLTPQHVAVHLPEVNFLVRGAGEEVFPRLVKILADKGLNSPLTKAEIEDLQKLKGVIFRNKVVSISATPQEINELQDYDRSLLDFGFITGRELSEGLNLFTSRGCFSNCFFCTTPSRGKYVGKSFENLKKILKDYRTRLKEIFKGEITSSAFKLSFNDDDFLADPQRAQDFFRYLLRQPFCINFFQTGINSFFIRKNAKFTNTLNPTLLHNLKPRLFSSDKHNIYIGTENFCDAELRRLGKGYGFFRIEKVVRALSRKKIYQAHHFIASNQLTTPQDLLDNLFKIAGFRLLYGEYFNILTPIIPYLVSLYPSASYRICVANKRQKFLNIRRILSCFRHPEYDYPLVQNDIPINKITRRLIPVIQKLFLNEKDYTKILDKTLFELLLLQEKCPSQKTQIKQLIDRYKDYPRLIYRNTARSLENDRNNLQLMITRRCHLRCKYCPIVKKNLDMSQDTLYGAIDLLFTSSRDRLRLDFTGGEPLLRFDLVKKGVEYARKLAHKKNKSISFYLVTNLIALNEQIADFLAKENFFLELSVDGSERFHNLYKVGASSSINPYRLTVSQLNKVFCRKIDNYAVMVCTPATVKYLAQNFHHLLKLGFRKISINYALGLFWKQDSMKEFFQQLDLIRTKYTPFIERGLIGLSNLESRLEPAILNSEIMADADGEVHLLTDWLFEKESKKNSPCLGRIKDFKSLNGIFLSKFRVLHRLLECYLSRRIQKVIFNNIEMGNQVKEYFAKWKAR